MKPDLILNGGFVFARFIFLITSQSLILGAVFFLNLKEEYGTWLLVYSIFLFGKILDIAGGQAAVKIIAQAKSEIDVSRRYLNLLITHFVFSMCILVLGVIINLVINYDIIEKNVNILIFAMFVIVLQNLLAFNVKVFDGLFNSKHGLIAYLLGFIGLAVCFSCLAIMPSTNFLYYGLCAQPLCGIVYLQYRAYTSVLKSEGGYRPDLTEIVGYAKEGLLFQSQTLTGLSYDTSVKVILGKTFGPEILVNYELLYKLFSYTHLAINSLFSATFPFIAGISRNDDALYFFKRARFWHTASTTLIFLVATPAVILLMSLLKVEFKLTTIMFMALGWLLCTIATFKQQYLQAKSLWRVVIYYQCTIIFTCLLLLLVSTIFPNIIFIIAPLALTMGCLYILSVRT